MKKALILFIALSLVVINVVYSGTNISKGYAAAAQTSIYDASKKQACKGLSVDDTSGNCSSGSARTLSDKLKLGINILSVVVGFVAVLMVIVGGFKYVTSQGESNAVSGAKNTILYAVIGLVIAVLGQVIVRVVLSKTSV